MKRLGEILIEQGTLISRQLEIALEKQKRQPGKLLGEVLIEMGLVSEEDIVVALATQFNVPYLPVANFSVDEKVKQLIPLELIRKHMCIPLEKIGNLFMIVIADPTNEEAIHEIEQATQCKVQAFVAPVSEISGVIRQSFGLAADGGLKTSKEAIQISFRSVVDQKNKAQTSLNP